MLCTLCWANLKYGVFHFLFTVRNIALKMISEKKTELNEEALLAAEYTSCSK